MSDRCPDCGGTIVGDGYTMAQHCEYVDLPDDREADAPLLTCGFVDDEEPESKVTECKEARTLPRGLCADESTGATVPKSETTLRGVYSDKRKIEQYDCLDNK